MPETDEKTCEQRVADHPLVSRLRDSVGTTDMDRPPFYNDVRDATLLIQRVHEALHRCHESFHAREHGGVAEQRLRHDIEAALRRPYDG